MNSTETQPNTKVMETSDLTTYQQSQRKKRIEREEKDPTQKTKKKLRSALDNSNNHNLLSDLEQQHVC